MTEKNLMVTQFKAHEEVFPDVSITANDEFAFIAFGQTIVKSNFPVEANSGLEITPGSGIKVSLSGAETAKLPLSGCEYNLYRREFGGWVKKYTGTITVSEGEEEKKVITLSYSNSNASKTVTADYVINRLDDTIFCDTTISPNITLIMPLSEELTGKRFKVKNIGSGTVSIEDCTEAELIQLSANEGKWIESSGKKWETMF